MMQRIVRLSKFMQLSSVHHKQQKAKRVVDTELQEVFLAFHKKFIVAFRKKMEELHFTLTQVETLRFIIEKGNPTMKDIAQSFSISPPSATSMIEMLSHKKLVKRQIDTKDRRTTRIVPTEKAMNLFDSLRKIKSDMFSEIFMNISDTNKRHLTHILKQLM